MQVEVRAFATLRQYLPELGVGEARLVQVEPGTTLGQLCDRLGIPRQEVMLIMRNHVHAQAEDTVQDGDRIAYVPAVGGG